MPWIELSFEVDAKEADHFSEICETQGAVSVSYFPATQDPILEPKPGEMPLWNQVKVVALYETTTPIEKIIQKLNAQSQSLVVSQSILADQEWSLTWKDYFKPERYGKKLWIIPEDSPLPNEDGVFVKLAPGLAFGTGNHTTTALCLKWLDGAELKNKTIMDYGCGSGILAISSLMLGARQAIAIDYDPQALQATLSNARLNGITDTLSIFSPEECNAQIKVDIVIANILAPILVELAPKLKGRLKAQGQIVLAGLLSSQVSTVCDAYQEFISFNSPIIDGEWALLSGRFVAD